MKKIFSLIFISAAIFLPISSLLAQTSPYTHDALLFSRHDITGSARIRGMGGVQTSLGGDISSAFNNPAGLGFYNRSEVSFSPTYLSGSNNASYFGTNTTADETNLHASNLGLVIASKKRTGEGWLGGNFGISYQRVNNFHNQLNYEGFNPNNGLINVISNNYDLYGTDDILAEMAWETYLLGDFGEDDKVPYTLVFPATADEPYDQVETINSRGHQSQLNISYGGNISDKYYFGAGIGLVNLDYRRERDFQEYYFPEDDINAIALLEDQLVRGSGINATLGFIARPAPFFSIGISYQTPTVYELQEDTDMQLDVLYNNLTIFEDGEPVVLDGWVSDRIVSTFNYNLRTPGRLNIGGTFFFEKQGFISADVELVDYRNNKLSDADNFLSTDNQDIQSSLNSVVNVRLGGEYRYEIFRFRAGYALNGDPYHNNSSIDRGRNILSAGAGIRLANYYVDFAFNRESGQSLYTPYVVSDVNPVVNNEMIRTTAMVTLGLNF